MPNKRIEEVCITNDIQGSDKLLVVKNDTCQTRSVTVDNFIHENSICTGEINNCAITEPKIDDGAITTRHMTANTIDGCVITGNSINANKIVSGTITSDQITSSGITADCVTTGTLDASCVTVSNLDAANITSGSINANRIASDTIVSCHINSCSIQSCHLAACSVDAGKIAVDAVGATAIAAGSVAATALESNIIIAGSIQSSNFDGFNYVDGTTGDQLLQYLNAGENGFFLDERTGTAVFTDIIARDNVIAANYIKYNENSGLSAIDATGNFGVNVDTDFMSIQDGKVTITRIPSDTVVDQSLFTTPNTIFFGQSETQIFELPTINQEINFFGNNINDTSTWSLCSMSINIPNLYNSGNNYQFSTSNTSKLYLYHENDFRNVDFYKSEFVSDSLLPADSSRTALDDSDTSGNRWYNEGGAGVLCEHVILLIDLHALGVTAAQINGNIVLNNLKIRWDTSNLNVLSLIQGFNLLSIKSYMSSTTAIHSDISSGGRKSTSALVSQVLNPTVIGDIFEATIDITLGHPKTAAETGGNAQRFITLVIRNDTSLKLQSNTFPDYRGYLPLSAEFTTDTNLRFEAMGAIPETKNFDLSSINHLIPGKQLVRATDHTRTQTRAHIPFEWIEDRPRQLGFPEININSPLSGSTALDGGTPVRDILETHGSWTGFTTYNGF
tara:strand:- start:2640 stop:4661 length:2022 start_codon:yes stop_codon:yes gene_type:complete